MTIENVCRINVWPTMAAARAAFDGADGSELCGRMIVWPTTALAKEYYTENSGEGGGGAPEWVPAGAKIHIDFLGGTPQGRAWADGTGEVALNTLLGHDDNANSYGSTTFNPSLITANGYVTGGNVAFIGAARSMALSGVSLVYTFNRTDSALAFTLLLAMSTDWNNAINIQATNSEAPGNTVNGYADTGSLNISTVPSLLTTAGSINRFAFTFVADRLDIACNGNAAVTGAIGAVERPPANPLTAFVVDPGDTNAIQSITFYDPLPTTAGLSALSAIT